MTHDPIQPNTFEELAIAEMLASYEPAARQNGKSEILERQQLLSQAALHASETVRTETYRAALERATPLTAEQAAELRQQCERISRHMQVLGIELVRVWQPVINATIASITEFYRQLVEAGLVADVEPSDVAARALHRRRHRNTGPQQRTRAPRRIDPRGCQ